MAGSPAGPEPAEVRQERITALVEEQGFVRVRDLSARFGVSTVTVRTDLQSLESHGRVRRIRGGAMPPGIERAEQPFEVAEHDLASEKAAIGSAARRRSWPTATPSCSTSARRRRRSPGRSSRAAELREVTVVTNGLTVALVLERAWPRISVVVTGGTLRPLQHSLVNPLGTVLLDGLNASIAFIGCNGVDVRGGVTNVNLPEAEVKRAMLLSARRPVVVADGSKLGEVEVAKICDLSEVSLVVTDASADPSILADLAAVGCDVQVADRAR